MKSFGVQLSQAARAKGKAIPTVPDLLISHLEANALSTEGLFRVSGNALRVKELIVELETLGEDANLFKYEHTTVAETLKKYFSELPEPIVPPLIDMQVKSLFEGGIRRPAEEIIPEMKFAVDSLSEINFHVLERLSKLLAGIVANSDKNKMSLPNIVTCIAPTMRFTPAILTYSIVHHKHFFETDPVAPPEELKLLAEGTAVLYNAACTTAESNSSNPPRLNVATPKHNRKSSAPPSLPSKPTPTPAEKEENDIREKILMKEESLKEKQRLKDDVRRQLKDEFNKERQIMVEEVLREKDIMKAEMHREKGFLKELYSKEKRLYKDEARRLRKELDMARTVIQTLKDKIDTFAEVNYELERKLKKQHLKNKAQQLDIESLHRKIIKTSNRLSDSKLNSSPRVSAGISSSFDQEDSSSSHSDDLPKRDDVDIEAIKKKYEEKRSKSRSKRRSAYLPRSGSSSAIDDESNTDSVRDKKDKTKELLKRNTTKLLEETLNQGRRSSSSLSSSNTL